MSCNIQLAWKVQDSLAKLYKPGSLSLYKASHNLVLPDRKHDLGSGIKNVDNFAKLMTDFHFCFPFSHSNTLLTLCKTALRGSLMSNAERDFSMTERKAL